MFTEIVFLFLAISHGSAKITEAELTPKLRACFNRQKAKYDINHAVGLYLYDSCMNLYISKFIISGDKNDTPGEKRYMSRLLGGIMTRSGRIKRQAGPVRKEIRQLTIPERDAYHAAVIRLKTQTVRGGRSRYDIIASRHSGENIIDLAHNGAVFGPWHRIFLLIYEFALRRIDASVALPYYASDLDEAMGRDERLNSVVWSETFFGNCDGLVTNGPFANWETPAGPLMRQCGIFGNPYTFAGIARVMNRTQNAEIFHPMAEFDNNLEIQHDFVHAYIGGGVGQITQLNFAAYDPLFFNHHAYVDKLWLDFRFRQRDMHGIRRPDYPPSRNVLHRPNANLGFGRLRNREAFRDVYATAFYRYEPLPTCNLNTEFNCGNSSPFYRCNTQMDPVRCCSLTTNEARGIGGPRKKRQTHELGQTFLQSIDFTRLTNNRERNTDFLNTNQVSNTMSLNTEKCGKSLLKRSMQNSFYLDGKVDSSNWVYISVEVINIRPPEKRSYDSYFMHNGSTLKTWDIYSSHMNNKLQSEIKAGHPKGYSDCEDPAMNAAKIFIGSNGLNYYGVYKEYVVADKRMPVSSNVGYVAVKSPENGDVEAIVNAHDSCGRICKAYCLVPGSNNEYRLCNGAIRLSNQEPKMYGKTIAECIDNMWNFPKNKHCPSTTKNGIFLKFYCDYKEDWPWIPPRNTVQTKTPQRSSHKESKKECVIEKQCTIQRKCGSCNENEKQACIGEKSIYARCSYGRFKVFRCYREFYFDVNRRLCIRRPSYRKYRKY